MFWEFLIGIFKGLKGEGRCCVLRPFGAFLQAHKLLAIWQNQLHFKGFGVIRAALPQANIIWRFPVEFLAELL